MKKKTIISSLLTIAICLTLIAGSTYALFTSEDEINIAVTSGKVKVTATVDNLVTYSMGKATATQGKFDNGGTAVLNQETATDMLTLTNITPGDKVTFDIVVKNESNVSIVYSLAWRVNGELANALVATANDEKIENSRTSWKVWEGEATQKIAISVELPTNYTTQSESATITFAVEAYQGNASFIKDVAELNQKMLQTNEDLMLIGANEPNAVVMVPASYTGTLTLNDCTVASVQAEKDLNLVVAGNVAAKAIDSSAITAKGVLNISGNGMLTAIAADVNGGFGIGGMDTTEINIKDVTILKVSGAFVQKDFINDTKYGKSEPEGGAAIGSGLNGAIINLSNVTINEALGGSKAAGIGARYWTGVEINIADSTIYKVVGGNASAAIGSSRVSNGATESGTIINITRSNITAIGGQAGAGIGSGYDTHCQSKQPLCTINISDSTINATGGKYAAGIGSGYHNAALAGEIKNSTINAVSGEKFYKDAYTLAQDIGFGVVDPAREGQQIGSYLIYNGEKIYLDFVSVVSTADEAATALAAGKDIVLKNDIELTTALTVTEPVIIQLNGKTLSTVGLNFTKDVVIENGTITSAGGTNMTPHLRIENGKLTMNNVDVTIDDYLLYQASGSLTYAEFLGMEIADATAVLTDCNITVNTDVYRSWNFLFAIAVTNGNITIDGGKIVVASAGYQREGQEVAISVVGNATVTMKDVEVQATTYGASQKAGAHLILNTNDTTITDADVVSNGGTYEVNIIN